jgi:hypothetical protein
VVPVSRIPALVDGVQLLAREFALPIVCFGHAGNGNLHVNLLHDPADVAQTARAHDALARVFALTLSLGGTLSGEHGIGLAKREFMPQAVTPPTLALMRQLKSVFDPDGILNGQVAAAVSAQLRHAAARHPGLRCEAHCRRPVLHAATVARLPIVARRPARRCMRPASRGATPAAEPARLAAGGRGDVLRPSGGDRADGVCYPGRPVPARPRPECRATWHRPPPPLLPNVSLTPLFGRYAQAISRRSPPVPLTATVSAWRDYRRFPPMPHGPATSPGSGYRGSRTMLPTLRERARAGVAPALSRSR